MLHQAKAILKLLPQKLKLLLAAAILLIVWSLIWKKCSSNPHNWAHVAALDIDVPLEYQIHGIDISHHNGSINWQEVKDFDSEGVSVKFAFIKASEGVSLPDKNFKQNWKKAAQAGIARGAYHYYIPWRDPESQMQLFQKQVGPNCGEFPPVLDIEENSLRPDSRIIKEIGQWLKMAEKAYGRKPIIYTNQSYYNKFVRGHYDHYPLWIADYSKKDLTLYPSQSLHFWQYSKKGKLEGISEPVDFNVYIKSEEDFEKLKN
jgi:lysozyme